MTSSYITQYEEKHTSTLAMTECVTKYIQIEHIHVQHKSVKIIPYSQPDTENTETIKCPLQARQATNTSGVVEQSEYPMYINFP